MTMSNMGELIILYQNVKRDANGNLDNIDVLCICNKIFIIVKKLQKFLFQQNVRHIRVTFEVISKVCSRLVKILQKQVQLLLELTKKFKSAGIFTAATEQKTLITTQQYTKRSRLILSETIKNYTYFDFEPRSINIRNRCNFNTNIDTCTDESLNETCRFLEKTKLLTQGSITDLQINEYTEQNIQMTSTENFWNDDEGFGNATDEDLLQLYNFPNDYRGSLQPQAPIQTSKDNKILESQTDRLHLIENSFVNQCIKFKQNNNNNEGTNYCKHSNCFNDKNADTGDSSNKYSITIDVQNEIQRKRSINWEFLDINVEQIQDTYAQVEDERRKQLAQVKFALNSRSKCKRKRYSNLIIDKINKIAVKKLRKQKFENVTTERLKENLKLSLKALKQSAKRVLTHLAKSDKKINFAKKHIQDAQPLFKDIPNTVINDIEQTANEPSLQSKCKVEQIEETFTNDFNLNDDQQFITNRETAVDGNCNDIVDSLSINFDIRKGENVWNVMMALLNMWRLEGYDKINAKFFCQKYGTRLKMAITFSALMVLAAKHFIVITKEENSIEMKDILLGPSSLQLINEAANNKD